MRSGNIHFITVSYAQANFGRLLERVQAGEELVITRYGQPIATLLAFVTETEGKVGQALRTLREVRASLTSTNIKVSRSEIRAWRNRGR